MPTFRKRHDRVLTFIVTFVFAAGAVVVAIHVADSSRCDTSQHLWDASATLIINTTADVGISDKTQAAIDQHPADKAMLTDVFGGLYDGANERRHKARRQQLAALGRRPSC